MERITLMSYDELVDIILLGERDVHACVQEISAKYPCLSEAFLDKIKKYLSESFLPSFHMMWEKTCRSRTKLRRDHSEWLKRSKTIDFEDQNLKVYSPTELEEHLEPKKAGRKRKALTSAGQGRRNTKLRSLESYIQLLCSRPRPPALQNRPKMTLVAVSMKRWPTCLI